MLTNVTSEKSYKISYFKPASKKSYGFSVEVVGDKKVKVIKEARELLLEAEEGIKKSSNIVESEEVENV